MTKAAKKISKTKLLAVVITILVVTSGLAALYFESLSIKPNSETRIACMGDSTTEITGYPEDLQALLGTSYKVGNFGVTGATILLNTDRPYLNQTAFQKAKQFLPNIVIIMLGTNDARTNIYLYSENFEADYKQLISEVQAFASKPKILLAIPPPIFNNSLSLSSTNLVQGVIPRIEQVARELGLQVINIYGDLANHPEYFPDGVHPNSEGAKIMASAVFIAVNATVSATA